MKKPERRVNTFRRDLNELFRGVDGKISGSKIGTYAGQIIAARLLLINDLPTWDVLAVLLLVLIAPEAYKQMMAMKWGGSSSGFTTMSESSKSVTRTKGVK